MIGPVGPGTPGELTVRFNDYALSEEQEALGAMVTQLLGQVVTPDVVRACEPEGFDPSVWASLADAGIVGLSLPDVIGGQGAGIVELVVAAEQLGRVLAPAPVVEHAVAARALLRTGAAGDMAAALADGSTIVSLAPLSARRRGPQLVPGGSVATTVLALDGDVLWTWTRDGPPPQVANQAAAPLAWWDPDDPAVRAAQVADGDAARAAWTLAVAEWRVGGAAQLVGLADGAARLARTYAVEREAFGRSIARFQAVSHALVDQHLAIEPARNLARKAAWFLDHERDARPELPAMAHLTAPRCAREVTASAVHVHGGVGITLEADVSLHYRRAAAVAQVGGSSVEVLRDVAADLRPRFQHAHEVAAR